MPKIFLGMYGMSDVSAATAVTAQSLGAALLTYGIVAFFARDSSPSEARKAIVIGFCLTLLIGGIVLMLAVLAGIISALGWMGVFIYWIMALGYAYFWFIKKED